MTTRVLLVRHGATTLSAEDRFAGSTDVDLSDEGRAQAGCLAERLAAGAAVGGLRQPDEAHARDGAHRRPPA